MKHRYFYLYIHNLYYIKWYYLGILLNIDYHIYIYIYRHFCNHLYIFLFPLLISYNLKGNNFLECIYIEQILCNNNMKNISLHNLLLKLYRVLVYNFFHKICNCLFPNFLLFHMMNKFRSII